MMQGHKARSTASCRVSERASNLYLPVTFVELLDFSELQSLPPMRGLMPCILTSSDCGEEERNSY